MDDDGPEGEAAGWLSSHAHEGRTRFGHGEIPKYDVLLAAFGDCAEANAIVGVAAALGSLSVETTAVLTSVQNDMLDLAADLSVPLDSDQEPLVRMTEAHLRRLERAVEHLSDSTPDPEAIVLPGGTVAAALLYQARMVSRRAERSLWRALEEYPEVINPLTGRFLNRLSTLLLVLARAANEEHGNLAWDPGASVKAMQEET